MTETHERKIDWREHGVPSIVQVEQELYSRNLHDFIVGAWPTLEPGTPFVDGWHIGAICEHLEAVTRREIRNLVINVSPRTMKSMTVAVGWQPWCWTQNPSLKFVFASYSQNLSMRDSLRSRRLVKSNWYQARWGAHSGWHKPVVVANDQDAKNRYETSLYGYRIATSVDGMGTGEGGDFFVADDPHNIKEAESEAKRGAVLFWWDEVVPSRLNDQKTGCRIIIMQRTHDRDLSGHILAKELGYDHLCIPMRYEAYRKYKFMSAKVGEAPQPNKDYIGSTTIGWRDPRKKEGELMWPARMGLKEVDELENALGPYAYSGQYQQRPSPRGGGMFKRANAQVIDALPADLKVGPQGRSWDFAGTDPTKQQSLTDPDWTAGVRGFLTAGADPDLYILDVVHDRLEPGDRDDMVTATAVADGRAVTIWLEQEPGQSGKSQIEGFRKRPELVGYGINPPRPDPMPSTRTSKTGTKNKEPGVPTGSKITRAEALATLWHRRKVFLLRGDWNAKLINELVGFPRAAHDDIVDATSQLLMRLAEANISTAEIMDAMGYYDQGGEE